MIDGKIVVALSGGVDSSVTAKILSERYPGKVAGLFMKNWEEDDDEDRCSATQDVQDAEGVCDTLGIPLYTVNLSMEYWARVFEDFIHEYKQGRTPNPDVFCNQEIKFKAFLEHARHLGAEKIATGHYARNIRHDNRHLLYKGSDPNKDQSYFLYRLDQYQLSQTLFPIGEMHKPEIRQIAASACFANQDKKDSTGICFIGERPFRAFLGRYIDMQKGEIRSPEGKSLGEHDGVFFYTIGQRQGIGLGGVKGEQDAPWYVVAKDMEKNTLIVAQGHDNPLLFSSTLTAINCHWIGASARPGHAYQAKIRYRQPDQACQVVYVEADRIGIRFQCPQRAVTPGQSVVIYDGEQCLGGGIIDTTDLHHP